MARMFAEVGEAYAPLVATGAPEARVVFLRRFFPIYSYYNFLFLFSMFAEVGEAYAPLVATGAPEARVVFLYLDEAFAPLVAAGAPDARFIIYQVWRTY